MLTGPTLEQLAALKLDAMAAAWTTQQQEATLVSLAFDERFGLLVDAEWLARENRRLARALQEAKLKLSQASVEAIDYSARRGLDKAMIRQLATCRWVQEHQNVLVIGAAGVGKSFLACALAHQACRKGYRALYRRAPRLFQELGLARADATYIRVLAKLARIDVFVLDDWGLTPVQDQERRDLLEILDIRATARKLAALQERRLDRYDVVALVLDGKRFAEDKVHRNPRDWRCSSICLVAKKVARLPKNPRAPFPD